MLGWFPLFSFPSCSLKVVCFQVMQIVQSAVTTQITRRPKNRDAFPGGGGVRGLSLLESADDGARTQPASRVKM
jgi:hypothetical protein